MNRAAISTVLLVLQLSASAAVPLVHASERESAPVTLEAHHDASCPVLHDAARCALCWYAGSLVPPPSALAIGPRLPTTDRRVSFAQPRARGPEARTSAQPRAPPFPIS